MAAAYNYAWTLISEFDFIPNSHDGDDRSSSSRVFGSGDILAGKYQLDSILAEGGMGRIWHARDQILGRSVAVKLVYERDCQPEEASNNRLLAEARATARLRHPAIVEVVDFGRVDGREAFLVMELLDGEDLRSKIFQEGCIPAIEAVRTLLPILGALEHAHSRGVVHRDVKPDNIFLVRRPDGSIQPKLIDFGLAKMVGDPLPAAAELLVGSPAYMSPEQGEARDAVDSRTDLWAFAVALYETIAGETPWAASNWPALLHSIESDPPPSLIGKCGVDEALSGILQRGLEKSPDARWQTSREFAAALEGWLSSQSIAEDVVDSSSWEGKGIPKPIRTSRHGIG